MSTGDVLFLISVIMTIISGLDYLIKNIHYFKESTWKLWESKHFWKDL